MGVEYDLRGDLLAAFHYMAGMSHWGGQMPKPLIMTARIEYLTNVS